MDDDTRNTVSKDCLLGAPVPKPLEVLWDAFEEEDDFLTDTLGLTLLTSRDDLEDGYGDELLKESEDVAANVRAHRRLFERLQFFARRDDGELWAFDRQTGPLDDPPVLELDTEGQYTWIGANVAEAVYRVAEDADEGDEAIEWLEEAGLPLEKPGEVGTTTGHLPGLGKLQAGWYWELLGKPRAHHPSPDVPANARDAMTWFLRPGDEVLAALRELLGLKDNEYPEEQWLGCDGEGRVINIWLHAADNLTVRGVAYGSPRADVVAKLGATAKDFEGENCRHDVGPAYLLFEFEDDVVTDMYIGLDDDD